MPHTVFISYHHGGDAAYKEALLTLNRRHSIFTDGSVNTRDIDERLPDDTIRQIIRDDYLRDTTVTIAQLVPAPRAESMLIGRFTPACLMAAETKGRESWHSCCLQQAARTIRPITKAKSNVFILIALVGQISTVVPI